MTCPSMPAVLRPVLSSNHAPHADQRVSAGPEQQLLQIPHLLQVPCLTRREDPLPQTPYVLLDPTPINSVPVQGFVRRSVHLDGFRLGVQLVLRFQHRHQVSFTGSPGPRQLPCGPGTLSRIRPVIHDTVGGQRLLSWFPAAFRLPAFACWTILSRWGSTPPSRSAYQAGSTASWTPARVSAFRTCETRPGRVPSLSRGQWCPLGQKGLSQPTSAASRRPAPTNPAHTTHHEEPQSRDVIEGSRSFTLPVFLSPVAPGWNRSPPAFPRAPNPAVTSNARRGEDRSMDTDRGLHHQQHRTSLGASTHYRATSRRTAALRNPAERVTIVPVFEVSGFQHVPYQPEKPVVLDFLRQYPEKDIVVKRPEAVGDIPFDKPGGSGPDIAYFPQGGVASPGISGTRASYPGTADRRTLPAAAG